MKKQQTAKSYVVSALVLGLTVMAASASHAAFSSISKSTYNAVADLTGVSGTVAFNAAIRNVSDGNTASQLGWSSVTLPYTTNGGWKLSDQFVDLASTFTVANGGLQIYTDNTSLPGGTTTYQYSGSNPPSGGLVDSTNHTTILPLGWTVINTSTTPTSVGNPDVITTWFYSKDKLQLQSAGASSDFVNGEVYVTALNDQCAAPANPGNTCIHFASGASASQSDPAQFGGAASPNAMYFEANFASAVAGRNYGTKALTLEAFSQ